MPAVPEPLTSWRWWHEHRQHLLFGYAGARDTWQAGQLRRVLARHAVSWPGPILRELPPPSGEPPRGAVTIHTSGTLSSRRRAYFYQRPQFDLIQAHQWWRVERELQRERPGPVVGVAYNPFYAKVDGAYCRVSRRTKEPEPDRPLDRPETHLDGPWVRLSVGRHNPYYEWTHSRYTTRKDWQAFWELMRSFRPKLLLMAPSQLQAAWPAIRSLPGLPFPVVMTTEVLDRGTREMARLGFSAVLDKMRCWDGGLSFVECREGRLHCLDELCLAEVIDGTLVSTDFFNYAHPFFRYANGDDAELAEGPCDCGVFGRYFPAFHGRVCQRVVIGGESLPGVALTEDVTNFLYFGTLPSFRATNALAKQYGARPFAVHVRWQLRQHRDGDFEFRYSGDLDAKQLACLEAGVRFIVLREGDLPAGDLDRREPSGQRLDFMRDDGLGDSIKNLSVVSEAEDRA